MSGQLQHYDGSVAIFCCNAQLLAENDILSAPLVVSSGLEDMECEAGALAPPVTLLGWIDVNDLMNAFIARAARGSVSSPFLRHLRHLPD